MGGNPWTSAGAGRGGGGGGGVGGRNRGRLSWYMCCGGGPCGGRGLFFALGFSLGSCEFTNIYFDIPFIKVLLKRCHAFSMNDGLQPINTNELATSC